MEGSKPPYAPLVCPCMSSHVLVYLALRASQSEWARIGPDSGLAEAYSTELIRVAL
ncbi:uncharacterized protein L969DRAFT_100468 [Mixia osmundae IAM 14324]|uniref:Uncharacterized protein n=1 Tax=Mixia osmundae (strain CBS 9802 / IAM 14324 / JCM 22182 / KY 12970) TaxID=764103 RepID=G7E774_MIXOS|nr:uncharacterized protein L969DRAFT_100468 [Mixia osmundae IAM 14324]KEI41922.1 hypothetical protein L969DRAFT_100468 [Mixia osmundae IAM 14324]GAA98684.1 hypothetical protein E5Q_05372 [Mixia osmundae IAM 14324]